MLINVLGMSCYYAEDGGCAGRKTVGIAGCAVPNKKGELLEQMYAPLACNERMAAVMPRDHSGGCVLVT